MKKNKQQPGYEIIGGHIVHNDDPEKNEQDEHPGIEENGESCIGDEHYFQHAADEKISCYYCGLSRYVFQDDSE